MDIDKLTLISGNDIFVKPLKANIHQPSIKEIAIIGEENFYKYLSIFNVTVESVIGTMTAQIEADGNEELTSDLVKSALGDTSDFEVIMQMLHEDQSAQYGFEAILMLLLPKHSSFSFEERFIMCMSGSDGNVIIDETGFIALRDIVKIMFCLDVKEKEEFNPLGDKAKSIVEKIKKGREKIRTEQGGTQEKISILANYVSALSIGSNALNIKNTIELTVYQLFNQMERFGLFNQHNINIKAAIAGAKDIEPTDWLKTL